MDMLSGVKIISFNHFLLGPVGIQLLADLGADVIAVEPLGGAFQRKWGGANKRVGDQTVLFLTGNRNKRSLALDLKIPAGLEIARALIAQADVVAENFRPGVMDKLGLGYETLKARQVESSAPSKQQSCKRCQCRSHSSSSSLAKPTPGRARVSTLPLRPIIETGSFTRQPVRNNSSTPRSACRVGTRRSKSLIGRSPGSW